MQYTQKQNYIKKGKEPLPDSYTGTTCVVFFLQVLMTYYI